jgi:uncharacterized protein YndB with AHSA1/START domain
MGEEVRTSAELPLTCEESFALFSSGLGSWWPQEFSWSQGALGELGMETRVGGFLYEIGPHGLRLDWGRVLAWDPPARLVFSWHISPARVPEPDPARASEVDVRFEPADSGCRVSVVHRGFERHGEGAARYAEMMGSQGWPYALERLVAAAV